MPFVVRQSTVAAEQSGRIDRLVQTLAGGSRSHVTGLFDHDCVRLNGELTRDGWRRLRPGDRIEVRFEEQRRYVPLPPPRRQRGFTIVYEDRHLIVVDKAPELLTVPTPSGERNTLIDRVRDYVRRGGARGAFKVHRLDRGVSGLLVFGKSPEVADRLTDQFAARKPERRYVAIVAGRLAEPTGEFRSYLATDKALNRFSTDDTEIGQYAETHYRVAADDEDTTLVDVWLATGRRNQIRVHFAEAGHPVLGDPRYAPETARHPRWRHTRLALHAQTLGFEHPITHQPIRCEARLPEEMRRFLQHLFSEP